MEATLELSEESREQIYIPSSARIYKYMPTLSLEIGEKEMLLLLQLDYLISRSKTEKHNDRYWTYQKISDFQKMFPTWSDGTVVNVINSLRKQNLILVGCFNKDPRDRTRWYSINSDEISKLKTIISRKNSSEIKISPEEKEGDSIEDSIKIDCNSSEENIFANQVQNLGNDDSNFSGSLHRVLPYIKDKRLKDCAISKKTEIARLNPEKSSSISQKAKKIPRTTNPNIALLIKYYHDKFLDKFGTKPLIQGGKDAAQVKSILGFFDNNLDEAKKMVDWYFSLNDNFVSENGYTLGIMRSKINAYVIDKNGGNVGRENRNNWGKCTEDYGPSSVTPPSTIDWHAEKKNADKWNENFRWGEEREERAEKRQREHPEEYNEGEWLEENGILDQIKAARKAAGY